MPRIVISYRRADSAAMAGRIFDRLHDHFGDESMFMDIDSIPFGTDFRHYIREALGQSDVLVAVVGPRWLGPRETGRPRIHDATDPVRLEIDAALKRGLPIIPVLIDGAQMPNDDELPDDLKDFAFINAAAVDTGRDFRPHVDRLIRGIEGILAKTAAQAAPPAPQDQPPSIEGSDGQPEAPIAAAGREDVVATPAPPPAPTPLQLLPTQQPTSGTGSPSVGPEAGATGRQGSVLRSAGRWVLGGVAASLQRYVINPVLGFLIIAFVGVVIGLISFLSTSEWKREPAVRPTSTSRVDLAPSRDPVPSNIANRRDTNAPLAVPGKFESQPPANPAAYPNAQRVEPAGQNIPTIRWKLQNTLPTATPTALPQFAKRVADLSGGRMQIDILPVGAVAPAYQVPDAVQTDALDLGLIQAFALYGKDPALTLMSAVPFGFAPAEQLEFRQRAAPVFDRMLEQRNAVALPCGSFGRNGELWLKQRLVSTADLRGAKLRLVGLATDVYRELGSTITAVPASEIVPSLDRGLISGAQYGAPSDGDALGLPEVTRYFYYPGVVTPSAPLDLYLAKRKWEALGPAGRKIIAQACGEALEAMRADRERADAAALDALPRRGITVLALPATVERDLYAASRKVLTRFSDEDPTFRAVMAVVEEMRGRTLAARLR